MLFNVPDFRQKLFSQLLSHGKRWCSHWEKFVSSLYWSPVVVMLQWAADRMKEGQQNYYMWEENKRKSYSVANNTICYLVEYGYFHFKHLLYKNDKLLSGTFVYHMTLLLAHLFWFFRLILDHSFRCKVHPFKLFSNSWFWLKCPLNYVLNYFHFL